MTRRLCAAHSHAERFWVNKVFEYILSLLSLIPEKQKFMVCFTELYMKLPVETRVNARMTLVQESGFTLRAMRGFSGLSLTVMVSLYSATRSLSSGLFTCTTPV